MAQDPIGERLSAIERRLAALEEAIDQKASWGHCDGLQTNIERLQSRVDDVESKARNAVDHYDLRQLESKIDRLGRGY